MRSVLILSVVVLAATAYGQPVYEDSLDGMVGGWGATATSPHVEGDRTFTRIVNFDGAPNGTPEPPWNYYAGWTNVPCWPDRVDVSAAPTMEFDVRFHQEAPSGTSIRLRLLDFMSTPDFVDSPYVVCGVDTPAEVWYHVVVDMSLMSSIDLTQLGTYEFNGIYEGTAANGAIDYIDVDSLVFTPEPASLGLLGLGLLTVIRRR